MKRVKYFSNKNRYQYLPDRVEITHTLFLSTNKVKFNKKSYYFQHKYKVLVHKPYSTSSIVTFQTRYNGNEIIRDYLMGKLNYRSSKVIHEHRKNFIPSGLMILAKEKGFTQKFLLDKCLEIMHRKARINTREFIKFINFKLKTTVTVNDYRLYLRGVEISFDVVTPLEVYLVNNKDINDNLANLAKNHKKSQFINNMGDKISFDSYEKIDGDERTEIRGYYSDDSVLKVYTKEISKYGILNRVERSYTNNNHKLKDKFKEGEGLLVTDSGDFSKKIKILGKESFRSIKPLFSIEHRATKQLNKKMIKAYCKIHFHKYSEEAFKDLTTGNNRINTGQRGKSLKAVSAVARKLSRNGTFLRKIKVAEYGIDYRWLNQKSMNKKTQ